MNTLLLPNPPHPILDECRVCGAYVIDGGGLCDECRDFQRRQDRARPLHTCDGGGEGWQYDRKSGGRYR